MRRRRSLSFRLFVSSLAVVAVGVAALFVTARLLGPPLFEHQVTGIGQRYGWTGATQGQGAGHGTGAGGGGNSTVATGNGAAIEDALNEAFSHSLTIALLVALGISGAAAVVAAGLMAGRVLRPLDRVRGSVRRMAEGHYDEPVSESPVPELADLAGDVNALGAALAETEQRRARLVSDLAHEMRTPITSLDGYLEGIEDGVFSASPETVTAMREETKRLQRLAADLALLSRAEEQAFDLEIVDADLGAIALGAAQTVAPAFAAEGVSLIREVAGSLPVAADPDRMTQVLSNLLRNALRHTPPGGTVTVTGGRGAGRVWVAVADTGDGIAADHLPHLFERFYRGAGRHAEGTGIGLTIARSIARAHGGDVAARSPGEGRGATFTVTLPERA